MSLVMLAASMTGVVPGPALAQTDVAVELGASQVGPPAGLEGESARFGIAGLRASRYGMGGSGVGASLMLGRAFGDSVGGDFVSGVLSGSIRDAWGVHWTAGMDFELVGFQVQAPFPYRAFGVEGGPSLSYRKGPVTATAAGVFGVGGSRVELWRRIDGIHLILQDGLWRAGATGELLLGEGPVSLGLVGGLHDSAGGTYASGGARLVTSGGWGAAEVRGDVWETPWGETEWTGGLTFVIPIAGWSLRGFVGKSEPDPLTLAEPGSGSGGVLLGRSLYRKELDLEEAVVPYEVVSEATETARVRIRIDAPAGATRVDVLGDFTLWDAVPMRRDGNGWTAEVDVPYGTHHYGFLVDDEWYVPEDTQDVVPDEWGRLSAILVIEGAS
jgi:hypothetical protein